MIWFPWIACTGLKKSQAKLNANTKRKCEPVILINYFANELAFSLTIVNIILIHSYIYEKTGNYKFNNFVGMYNNYMVRLLYKHRSILNMTPKVQEKLVQMKFYASMKFIYGNGICKSLLEHILEEMIYNIFSNPFKSSFCGGGRGYVQGEVL